VLDRARGDVLAAGGDDDLLGATGDRQVPVGVERAKVSGGEPAVADGLGGGLLVVPVAVEDQLSGQFHLAVGGDPDAGAGHGSADGADALAAGSVDGGGGGALGEAVALVDGDA